MTAAVREEVFIHATAEVHESATVGRGTLIWNQAQIRDRAVIGRNCVIGKNVYIDHRVRIGNQVKIQNNSSIFMGVELADNVFVGPHVCFTNDLYPRAATPDGGLKYKDDWEALRTRVEKGASIGANATIIAGVTIGEYAFVGAASVVTRNVTPFGLVVGQPARLVGFVCVCGKPLRDATPTCSRCGLEIPERVLDQYRRLFEPPGRVVIRDDE